MYNYKFPNTTPATHIDTNTTSNEQAKLQIQISAEEIRYFQQLIRQVPVNDNVLRYAVQLASKTRPGTALADPLTNKTTKHQSTASVHKNFHKSPLKSR